jgi:hypothetical protein
MDLLQSNFDPPDKRAQNLALALPCQGLQVVLHLGRKLLHPADDQLEFPLQRLALGELLTLHFNLRNTLPELGHPGLEFLLVNEALGIAINQPGDPLA